MNNIKAIIFDMDGVLIDAREWHYESLNKALRLLEPKLADMIILLLLMGYQLVKNWKC